jgi:ABC-type transport system involved in multi-copper enzyme maturation permease subunit
VKIAMRERFVSEASGGAMSDIVKLWYFSLLQLALYGSLFSCFLSVLKSWIKFVLVLFNLLHLCFIVYNWGNSFLVAYPSKPSLIPERFSLECTIFLDWVYVRA